MSPASSSAISTNRVIYPAQGILNLISRAWNLLVINLKNSLLVVLVPTLLLMVFHLLIASLSSRTFLTPTTGSALASEQLTAILGAAIAIPAFFLWVLSCCTLSRFYYSAITQPTPLSLRECWQYTSKNWLPLCGLALLLSFCTIVMIAADFVILVLGITLSTMVIGAISLSSGGMQAMGSGIMMFFFLLAIGFVILSLMIGLATFQGFFFTFPLLAVSTAPRLNTAWTSAILQAYRLLLRHLSRLIPFALALFCFSAVLTTVLLSPVWVWAALEMTRLGLNQQHYIPMHIQSVINIASSMANLLILPFHISAVTLLWYDCQVRSEGLDLKIWFNDLLGRHEKQPTDFGADFF